MSKPVEPVKVKEADYSVLGLQRLVNQYEEATLREDGFTKPTRMEKTIKKGVFESAAELKEKVFAYFKEGVARGAFTIERGLDIVKSVEGQFNTIREEKMQKSKGVKQKVGIAVGATLLAALVLWSSHVMGPSKDQTVEQNAQPKTEFVDKSLEQAQERRLTTSQIVEGEKGLVQKGKDRHQAQQDAERAAWEAENGKSR